MFDFIKKLFKDFHIFCAAYSNNVFPEPLSVEEEEYYLSKYQHGDKQARDKLIEHNLRLVAHIVKKYEHKKDDEDDLISIGTIGLIKGIDSYSTKHSTRLTTYIARCIENEILMYLRKKARQKNEISLDEPLNYDYDGNELLLSDILSIDQEEVITDMNDTDDKEALLEEIEKLKPREKEILNLRFGLNGQEELTQKEVAELLGISQSYISRLEKKIIKKLKVGLLK